jgi:hypothetical protein
MASAMASPSKTGLVRLVMLIILGVSALITRGDAQACYDASEEAASKNASDDEQVD